MNKSEHNSSWRDVTFGDIQKGYWILVAVIFITMFAVLISACGSDDDPTQDGIGQGFITETSPVTGDTWECLIVSSRGDKLMHCEVYP